jgi:hypothetical protein
VPLEVCWTLWEDRERIPLWMPWIKSVTVQQDNPAMSRWTLATNQFGRCVATWAAILVKLVSMSKRAKMLIILCASIGSSGGLRATLRPSRTRSSTAPLLHCESPCVLPPHLPCHHLPAISVQGLGVLVACAQPAPVKIHCVFAYCLHTCPATTCLPFGAGTGSSRGLRATLRL